MEGWWMRPGWDVLHYLSKRIEKIKDHGFQDEDILETCN
jgi:hypothetical protein